MKQLLIILFLLFPLMGINADVVSIDMQPQDNVDIFNPIKRTPARIPEIGIDGLTLIRLQTADDITYNVEIYQYGESVFSAIWNFQQAEFVLPSELSGEFEIRLSNGTKTFVGYFNID